MNVLQHLAQSLEHLLQARNGASMSPQQIEQITGTIGMLQQHEAADEALVADHGQKIESLLGDVSQLKQDVAAIKSDADAAEQAAAAVAPVEEAATAAPPVAVVSQDPAHVDPTTGDDTTHDTVIVTDHPDGSTLVTPVLSGSADDLAPGDVTVDPATGVPTVAADTGVELGETTTLSPDASAPTAAAVAADDPDAVVSAGPVQAD